jgi:hypothetical protein
MGEVRSVFKIFVGKTEGSNHLEETCVDERMILKWLFER